MGRLLLIGISGLGGGLLFIGVFAILYPVRFPDWLGLSLFGLSCGLGGAIAWRLCGRLKLPSDRGPIDYEKLGLLVQQEFSIRRAFEVREFEDEGLHFFLELDDRRVLFLNGQYLYDYQEIHDDPEMNQPARFPCTKFIIKRHRDEHWVHSIECLGPYLKPEAKLPHYSKAFQKEFGLPTDGEILSTPYDAILAQLRGG